MSLNKPEQLIIDLHIHTTASDGSCRPAEVVRLAKKTGLAAIAITDHDTLDGIDEAIEAGKAIGVEVIPGIELSANFRKGTIHILGYYLNHLDQELIAKVKYLQEVRENRNQKMIENLNQAGIDISFNDLLKEAKGGLIARPHFARAMHKKGVVKTEEEAFQKYLNKGAPTYVSKVRFTSEEAIQLIVKNGGVPVLAHPITVEQDLNCAIDDFIEELISIGLQGLEVYYSTHDKDREDNYAKCAGKFDLLMTGGSDFHGSIKAEFSLGTGQDNLYLPMCLLDKMKKHLISKGRTDI